MTIEPSTPSVPQMTDALEALRSWQSDGAPWQLHPGDIGWFWRKGADATAAATRIWRRNSDVLAVGLLDGPGLIRLTVAPEAMRDDELAARLVDDLSDPERGIANGEQFNVESPEGALLKELLADNGWVRDEPWTPLRRDLTDPVPGPSVRIETVGAELANDWSAVQRSAFEGSRFGEEGWQAMAAGPAYADARCLLAYDESGNAVSAVAVWTADPGRPGLIEPLGAHPDHRGHGYGTAIVIGAAAELQRLGASQALVYTPSANVAGVATYQAAGFTPDPQIHDQFAPSSTAESA